MVNGGECSTVAAILERSVAEAVWLGPNVGGHPALVLHLSNEAGCLFGSLAFSVLKLHWLYLSISFCLVRLLCHFYFLKIVL